MIIMNKNYVAKEVKLDDLVLDKENPRFSELYNGSSKESDIVEYLLFTEAAEELTKAIVDADEFYYDRPLWVFKVDEKYIVKETTLYSAFTRMEKNGYITSFPGVGENGGKKRTYYQITDEGRLYYQSKCKEWALTKEVIEKFVLGENHE